MGASFLWRRDSAFWFQIAVPKDLRSLLGATPFRLRLPSKGDATQYARILAGVAERGFAHMRLTGIQDLNLLEGKLRDARRKILDALTAEIQEILSLQSRPDRIHSLSTKPDPLAQIQKRNEILEGLVSALREKALSIAQEYADFVEQTNKRFGTFHEKLYVLEEDDYAATEQIRDMSETISVKEHHLSKTREEVVKLKDAIVNDADNRKLLYDKANQVIQATNDSIEETRYLKESNEMLVERIDNQGPMLSKGLQMFLIDRRLKGVSEKEIETLERKIKDFIELIGDAPIASYSISDIQLFARKLTFLPERHKLDRKWKNKQMKIIIEENEAGNNPNTKYLCEKTIPTNYVGRVKTAIRWLCADHKVQYPFENAPRISVNALGHSIVRHGLPYEVVNRLLRCASNGATPEEIWLPLLGLMTGARLGELVYLRGADIRRQNGVLVVDLTNGNLHPGRNIRRPLKTEHSRRMFVVHEKICQLGFEDWASGRAGWIFPLFHKSVRPRNAASKRFQRLFDEWGLSKERVEVFHALRHTYKDWAREKGVEERTIALQTGHSLQGVALQYGTKALRPDEMRKLAGLPLPQDWDLMPYKYVIERTSALESQELKVERRRRRRKRVLSGPIPDWIGLPPAPKPTRRKSLRY